MIYLTRVPHKELQFKTTPPLTKVVISRTLDLEREDASEATVKPQNPKSHILHPKP